jgi:polyisoprenoid-binding protein YceI
MFALPLSVSADLSDVPSGEYTLDTSHGYITFTYSHLGFSNPRVGFNRFDTKLVLDSSDPENSTVEVTIDASSIDSRVAEFNDHLNGGDFFNTTEYPTITLKSTEIEATGENTFHPMRNVATVGVSASAKLMRSEWGLGAYVPAVSDEVELSIEVELMSQ